MNTALVLSGGGVRGAFEVGVVQGILEVLGRRHVDPPPFRTFVGSSVGAINASFFAGHAHRGDLGVHELAALWRSLELREHVKLDVWGMLGLGPLRQAGRTVGRSLLDPGPLEQLIEEGIDWHMLHDNIAHGRARALVVPALHVPTGATWVFAELAEGVHMPPTPDPRRVLVPTIIGPQHILASSAIPAIYPARRIGSDPFYDGGLRFNTPLKSALRAGAERLVVVTAVGEDVAEVPSTRPGMLLMLGKVLNTLLLDPVRMELESVERMNRVLGELEALSPEARRRFDDAIRASRGAPYRKVKVLSFWPHANVSAMSVDHLRQNLSRLRINALTRWLLSAATRRSGAEADWATFILFDGLLVGRLIELGREEAHRRADEITAFFEEED